MNWLKRKLRNWVNNDVCVSTSSDSNHKLGAGSRRTIDNEKGIRFVVHVAAGGRIVETTRYVRQKDENVHGLYIITSDQEFGHEIDKIITMEFLK